MAAAGGGAAAESWRVAWEEREAAKLAEIAARQAESEASVAGSTFYVQGNQVDVLGFAHILDTNISNAFQKGDFIPIPLQLALTDLMHDTYVLQPDGNYYKVLIKPVQKKKNTYILEPLQQEAEPEENLNKSYVSVTSANLAYGGPEGKWLNGITEKLNNLRLMAPPAEKRGRFGNENNAGPLSARSTSGFGLVGEPARRSPSSNATSDPASAAATPYANARAPSPNAAAAAAGGAPANNGRPPFLRIGRPLRRTRRSRKTYRKRQNRKNRKTSRR